MSLYHRKNFDVEVEHIVKEQICSVEIDFNGIRLTFPNGHIFHLKKDHFEEILKEWNLYHHS